MSSNLVVMASNLLSRYLEDKTSVMSGRSASTSNDPRICAEDLGILNKLIKGIATRGNDRPKNTGYTRAHLWSRQATGKLTALILIIHRAKSKDAISSSWPYY